MNRIIDAGLSLLGRTPNRVKKEQDENSEGVVSDKVPALTVDTDNEELARQAKRRQNKWDDSVPKQRMLERGKENERYYLGDQYQPTNLDVGRPMVDNAIYEAVQTHIPSATKRNPEPMVSLANTEDENEETLTYTKKLTKKLAEVADEQKLRLKLKTAATYQELYLLSVAKVGWDLDCNIPTVTMIRPEKLILDPDASVDPSDGYTGKYIGEYRTMEASVLLEVLKKIGGEADGIKLIEDLVEKDDGTDIRFIEWWEDDKMYWTMGKEVLLKSKNVNWNEDKKEGQRGINHFYTPRKPYLFLSVVNLGKSPVDETSNVTQNLSNQDRLNKRNRQIDKGMDRNVLGGTVVSLANAGLTQENVGPVTRALQNGGTVAIPSGRPEDAVKQIAGNGIPAEIFNDRDDVRMRLKDIFGTRGSSAGGLLEDKTVRGKYLNAQKDGDRVGGGVAEYLEQFADDIYNWFVQMLYVHDPMFTAEMQPPRIKVSVKEGSLLPKDTASQAAEARELAAAGLMSKLDLYKKLDYSNAEEMAANAWLEVNAPEVLYSKDPRVAQVIEAKAAAGQQEPPKAPSISIAYDSVPPDGQAQILAKAGITVHPEGIAAHNAFKEAKEQEAAARTAEHGATLEVEKAKAMPPKESKPPAK